MNALENTPARYGTVAVAFHWIMAILVVALVLLGLYMTRLPNTGADEVKLRLIMQHKQLGMIALILVLVRLAWRFGNILPRLVAEMPEWQKVAARFVHLCFYALLIALPMTGWLMSSAAGLPVPFLGLGYLPDLIGYSEYKFELLRTVHDILAWTLIPFILLHVLAALRHHFVDRDRTLQMMLPVSSRSRARSAQRPSAAAP